MKETLKLLRVRDTTPVDAELVDLSVKHLADFDTFVLENIGGGEATPQFFRLEI